MTASIYNPPESEKKDFTAKAFRTASNAYASTLKRGSASPLKKRRYRKSPANNLILKAQHARQFPSAYHGNRMSADDLDIDAFPDRSSRFSIFDGVDQEICRTARRRLRPSASKSKPPDEKAAVKSMGGLFFQTQALYYSNQYLEVRYGEPREIRGLSRNCECF